MKPGKINSYKTLSDIEINNKKFKFYSLKKAEENGLEAVSYTHLTLPTNREV